MIQIFIGLIISLVILIWSCEYAIKNSILISKIFQIREIFVGIFIIAIGTSLPEFAATFQALQIGAEGIVAGNLVGSNIANILLVGGIMVFPLRSLNIVKQDQSTAIFFISFSILFFFLIFFDFTLGFKFSLLFILLLILFFYNKVHFSSIQFLINNLRQMQKHQYYFLNLHFCHYYNLLHNYLLYLA